MPEKIKTTVEERNHPNLRKLARALIALAIQQQQQRASIQTQRARERRSP